MAVVCVCVRALLVVCTRRAQPCSKSCEEAILLMSYTLCMFLLTNFAMAEKERDAYERCDYE